MRIIFLISLVFCMVHTGSAQENKVQVHLKNGSVLKGSVVEPDAPGYLKIKSRDNVWSVPENEVDTVFYKDNSSKLILSEIPWFFQIDGGILTGNSENEDNSARFFHSSFNYGITGKLYAGGGTGAEYYMEQTYIPAFLNFQYKFRQTRFSPHLFLKAGYLFPGEAQQSSDLYEEYESRNLPPKYLKASGGIMINPGFGFIKMVGRGNFGFSLALGYRHHALNYSGKDKYEMEQRYNRISLSLSIIFK